MQEVDKHYFDIFNEILTEFNDMEQIISSTEVMSDVKLYNFYVAKQKRIEKIALNMKKYLANNEDIETLKSLAVETVSEKEKLEIKEQIKNTQNDNDAIFEVMKELYVSSKENEFEKIELEISSKDEIFRLEVLNMFENFAKTNGFDFQIQFQGEETSVIVQGENAFNKFNVFSGKLKKILQKQESFCVVAVLKKCDTDFVLNEDDLIIKTSKSSGAGGQHINKTESAVQITHIPTGITIECQDERSQTKNKARAIERLKEKITQNIDKNAEKFEENQRNLIKNKLFSDTPVMVFDFDRNKLNVTSNKQEYTLSKVLDGDFSSVYLDQRI